MQLREDQRALGALSDAELVDRTRQGDTAAYGVLWSRHSGAARAVAWSFTKTFEPDDLVSEAYEHVLRSIRAGKGPTTAFRAYLIRTVRNLAVSWQRRGRFEQVADADEFADPDSEADRLEIALEATATAAAFRSLPPRWQEVLWYVDVEQMKAQDLEPILGMSKNAIAALTYRAREGLRQAWIQAHLARVPDDSEHRWTVERLGAYARGKLSRTDTATLESHLAGCASCSVVAEEARGVASRLALVLLPLTIGVAGAAAYAEHLTGGVAATTAAATSAAGASPAAGTPGTPDPLHTELTGWFRRVQHPATLTASAAAVVVAAALSVSLLPAPRGGDSQAELPPTTSASPHSTATPVPPPTPPASTPPKATASPLPSPTPIATPGLRGSHGPATGHPTPAPGSTPTPTSPPPPVTPPDSPLLVLSVDTGIGVDAGRFFPILSGTATPYATITVAAGAAPSTVVRADASGKWSTDQLTGMTPGTNTVTVSQTTVTGTSAGSTSVNVPLAAAPTVTAVGGLDLFTAHASGQPNAAVQLLADSDIGWGANALDASGVWDGTFQWFTSPGIHSISVRYGSGNRFGPSSTAPITILP